MNRFPASTAKEIVHALERAGFVQSHQRGSHITMINRELGLRTVVSVHAGDIPRSLLKEIIKQAGFSEEEFRRFL